MSRTRAPFGWITGLKCPCCPLVCQPPPEGGTARDGLAEHLALVHPAAYAQWRAL